MALMISGICGMGMFLMEAMMSESGFGFRAWRGCDSGMAAAGFGCHSRRSFGVQERAMQSFSILFISRYVKRKAVMLYAIWYEKPFCIRNFTGFVMPRRANSF